MQRCGIAVLMHRVLRQITQCLGNIFDVMVVLFYLIIVFSIAGNIVVHIHTYTQADV